jgi:NAD(P)-dependent dehydrogenase (short-subunit alcohol dehydrogenase family)
MSFPYKKVVVIGGTSGIGLGFAERLVKEGVFVIAVGRRQERLDAFVRKAGSEAAAAAVAFDLADVDPRGRSEMPQKQYCLRMLNLKGLPRIIKAHRDFDCVFLNAGVQYFMDFSKPHTVDIRKIQHEITVNYVSVVALTHAFLPFFQAKGKQAESAFM